MSQTLEDLGQMLRKERELRDLSIEEVAEGLKISTRILYALEAGDSASLPHIVYVRGFVNAYARYLELDIQEILAHPVLHESEIPAKALVKPRKAPVQKKSLQMSFFLIVTICLCIGGGYALWYYRDAKLFSFFMSQPLSTAEPAPEFNFEQNSTENARDMVKQQQTIAKNQETENTKLNMQNKEDDTQSVLSNQREVAEPTVSQQEEKPVQQNEKMQATQKISEQVIKIPDPINEHNGQHRVVITAINDGNIEAIADETGVRRFSVKAGDIFALTFTDTLALNVSNAGGVRIHYDGKELPLLGKLGEAKKIIFPPEE